MINVSEACHPQLTPTRLDTASLIWTLGAHRPTPATVLDILAWLCKQAVRRDDETASTANLAVGMYQGGACGAASPASASGAALGGPSGARRARAVRLDPHSSFATRAE